MPPIGAAALRSGLARWAAQEERTLRALAEALSIVERGRNRARTLEELAMALLLSTARIHESRLAATLDRLDESLARLLDDVEAVRQAGGTASAARTMAEREADLRAIAEALSELSRFEDRVGRMVDDDAEGLRQTMRHALHGPPEPEPAAALSTDAAREALRATRPLSASRELGQRVLDWAEQIVDARRRGWTLEHPGVPPVRVPGDHPVLDEQLRRMREAVDAYRAAAPGTTDPAAAARAVEDLQQAVSDANETLRSVGRRFEATGTGDRLPPSRPLPPGQTPQPGSVAADALAAARRLDDLAARLGPDPHPSATEVSDALGFSDLDVRATGTLGEPLARTLAGTGLERYVLRPSEIRRLSTRPPWLAARLADMVAGWQRAHLVGPGFGGELFAGLMLAPWGVNQLAQNKGAEHILRQLAAGARATGAAPINPTVRATGRRLAIPLANGGFEYLDMLASVHYELPRPGRAPVTIDIHVDVDGSWRVTHTLDPGIWPADVPLSGAR